MEYYHFYKGWKLEELPDICVLSTATKDYIFNSVDDAHDFIDEIMEIIEEKYGCLV